MTDKSANPMKIVTPEMRASYANVFTPRAAKAGDKPAYSVMLLISKKDKTAKKFVKAVEKACNAALKKKFKGEIPEFWKHPLKDGDNPEHLSKSMRKKENRDLYKGMYMVNVKSYDKFPIVDRNRDEIMDSSEFKSGDYCRVSMNAGAYDHPTGGEGVSFWFNSIQKLRTGEALGAAPSDPDDDYDDLPTEEGEYDDEDSEEAW